MKYELVGRIIFEAEDTQDAFCRLSLHFSALANGEDSELPMVGTAVKIKPIDLETPESEATKTTSYRGHKT